MKNQKGQGMLEYIIITCLIGIFCLSAVKLFGEKIRNRINYMKEEVVETIQMN